MHRYLLALSACLSLAVGASQASAEDYLGIFLGTWHVGNDNLNDVNPGLSYGRRWPAARPGLEYHLEGGIFHNSYREVSPILLAGVSTQLAAAGPGAVRLGVSLGTAYYGQLSASLKEKHGIPNFRGFIPIAAISVSYRVGKTEYRVTAVPPDSDTKAVFNGSVALSF